VRSYPIGVGTGPTSSRRETADRRLMLLWVIELLQRDCQDRQISCCSQPIHRVPTGYPRLLHNRDQLSTLCGDRPCWPASTVPTVSQTPTYDQLRGERVNTDVPVSEADPQPVDRPGRHRLQDDATAEPAVPVALLGPRGDLAGSHPRFGRKK
jgi:hypothetical protein